MKELLLMCIFVVRRDQILYTVEMQKYTARGHKTNYVKACIRATTKLKKKINKFKKCILSVLYNYFVYVTHYVCELSFPVKIMH